MDQNDLRPHDQTVYTPAGEGTHHLVLGSVAVRRVIAGAATAGEFSLVELVGAPGSGPGPHLDPWRENFYILNGELTFRVEAAGVERTIVARSGDAVSIPQGIGHMFRVTSATPARFLIIGLPGGIDAFFADAGEPIARLELPPDPPPIDRARLQSAFAKHGLGAFRFAAATDATG